MEDTITVSSNGDWTTAMVCADLPRGFGKKCVTVEEIIAAAIAAA
jgi:hypothetical protein